MIAPSVTTYVPEVSSVYIHYFTEVPTLTHSSSSYTALNWVINWVINGLNRLTEQWQTHSSLYALRCAALNGALYRISQGVLPFGKILESSQADSFFRVIRAASRTIQTSREAEKGDIIPHALSSSEIFTHTHMREYMLYINKPVFRFVILSTLMFLFQSLGNRW